MHEGSIRVEGITIRDLTTGEERKLEVGGFFIEIGLIPQLGASKSNRR